MSNLRKLETFLSNIGFDPQSDCTKRPDILSKIGVDFVYQVGDLSLIYFKYISESTLSTEIFELHQKIWNENKTEAFVVVSDNKTLLCASKYKPDIENSLNCKLEDFSYGINSPGFEAERLKPLLKDNIDYGFFWDFVRKNINERRRKESVDYDLLLNLIKLKKGIGKGLSPEKSYILIERCLFLKFLEDRAFLLPKTLINILERKDSQRLLKKFDEVNKSLNGNVFDETIFTQKEISQNIIGELYNFFTTDYRTKQGIFFPYRFDIIPVELLSNIYEAFLKDEEQANNGIYYTPSNLVDLVLTETLEPILKKNLKPTCLDFACGSGIFLVKSLERIIDKNNCRKDFEEKKNLLKNCIFGVEKDPVATRITIFSLYLILLDGEDSDQIRSLIKHNKIKFPKLLNKNILNNNTLFDALIFVNEDDKKIAVFDVVVGNPPWSVNPFAGIEDNKQMKLLQEKQDAVNDYQSSQYFILKADDFMGYNSTAGIVFNNSNLLMRQADKFRKQILQDYTIKSIYELTQCNSILFNKQKIEDLKIGADEPPAVIIFKKKKGEEDNLIKYITPSLDLLSKFLRILVIKSSEIKEVHQRLFLDDTQLWRILTIGDMEDYRLIKKLESYKEIELKGMEGFSRTSSEDYKIILKDVKYVDKDCISPFVFLKDRIKKATTDGIRITVMRGGSNPNTKEYEKQKLLIKRYVENNMRIKTVYDDTGYRFKDNLIGLLFNYDYRLLLSFYNSSLVSFFLCFNSSQIGKGTWNMLHPKEIENVPIPSENNIPAKYKNRLITLTEGVLKTGNANSEMVKEIDEVVFNIYHLKEFEKQRIRDFFDTRYRSRNAYVTEKDLQKYVNRFRDVFRFILKEDKYLNTKGYISSSIGTGMMFVLSDKKEGQEGIEFLDVKDIKKFTQVVSKRQLDDSQRNKILKQEKIKIYDKNRFAVIKSNQFKDWTETEAIKDANEEIGLFLKGLPKG